MSFAKGFVRRRKLCNSEPGLPDKELLPNQRFVEFLIGINFSSMNLFPRLTSLLQTQPLAVFVAPPRSAIAPRRRARTPLDCARDKLLVKAHFAILNLKTRTQPLAVNVAPPRSAIAPRRRARTPRDGARDKLLVLEHFAILNLKTRTQPLAVFVAPPGLEPGSIV